MTNDAQMIRFLGAVEIAVLRARDAIPNKASETRAAFDLLAVQLQKLAQQFRT